LTCVFSPTFWVQNNILTQLVAGTVLNSKTKLEKIAREVGWLVRQPKKLRPIDLIKGMMLAVSQGECSFRLLASSIGLSIPSTKENGETLFKTISKKGLWDRINSEAVDFLQATLSQLIKDQGVSNYKLPTLPSISRIIVEDSTLLKLTDELLHVFSATNNQYDVSGAGLRFQFAVDLITGSAIRAELTKYGRNDQVAAFDILEHVREGDLVLRDLGYYVIDAFIAITKKGAHYLSRHIVARAIYHTEERGGERINLLNYLYKHAPNPGDTVDLDIIIGKGDSRSPKMNSRLVAKRLPQEAINKRLRKVKEDEKRLGKTRSKEYKKLQCWEIYITSLPASEANPDLICDIYRLRWRIEIIFKACKSYTPLNAIAAHKSNEHHVQCLLYAWLCLLVIATRTSAFAMAKQASGNAGTLTPNLLSLLKVIPRVFEMLNSVLKLSMAPINEFLDKWLHQIEYHDRYEKRVDRINMVELTIHAFDLKELENKQKMLA